MFELFSLKILTCNFTVNELELLAISNARSFYHIVNVDTELVLRRMGGRRAFLTS
jgi:hypothetical protein